MLSSNTLLHNLIPLIDVTFSTPTGVVTNVGGLAYQVLDGINGFAVPVGDVTHTSEALMALCRSADLRKAMGVAGHERFRLRFHGPMKIVAAAIVRDEARFMKTMIRSVSWVDTVVIYNDHSSDVTEVMISELARDRTLPQIDSVTLGERESFKWG